jgi:NTP pyrophosphatase (non-canonical NTP hydrolase)
MERGSVRMSLTKQQEEILRITQEECGEVIQIISKCCRFGIDEMHLKEGEINRKLLAEELGDLLCMIDLAMEFNLVNDIDLHTAQVNKRKKLKQWSTIFKDEE